MRAGKPVNLETNGLESAMFAESKAGTSKRLRVGFLREDDDLQEGNATDSEGKSFKVAY